MKKALLSMAALVLVLNSPGRAQKSPESPLASFMGVKWGVSIKEFRETFKFKDQIKMPDPAASVCNLYYFPLGSAHAGIEFRFFDAEGDLAKVTPETEKSLQLRDVMLVFSSEDFPALLALFKEKYGEPELKESEISNQLGAKFTQLTAVWSDAKLNRKIEISRFGSNIKYGQGMLQPLAVSESKRAKEKLKQDASVL